MSNDTSLDPQIAPVPRRYLDVRAAATYVGGSKSTLDKLRVCGGGPRFIRMGRRIVYDVRDLDAWIGTRRYRSTSEA